MRVALLTVGALMVLASSCVCGASQASGHGFFGDGRGVLLFLVGALVYAAGRFVGSVQKETSK